MASQVVPGSFRDPSGFVFSQDGVIYRQVNQSYKEDYDLLMTSGLYENLLSANLLIPHEEVSGVQSPDEDGVYKIIKPEMIPFISYPYEWCFSQFKDAALATLAVQRAALKFGMTLKDCSAYNIQFHNGKPVFIDTLSFTKYIEGTPWTPYKQFCQHFYGVLAMISYTDPRLRRLTRMYIDGVPLDLVSSVLPYKTKFVFPMLLHIHLHARSQVRYADTPIQQGNFSQTVSMNSMLGLLDSLEGGIRRLTWRPAGTEWADYYSDDSYTAEGREHKQRLIEDYISTANPGTVWDMGANTGFHSRVASSFGAKTVAFDVDPAAVEMNYLQVAKSGESDLLPLLLDLTNPSPSLGWDNDERRSLAERGPADLAMALALIHHLSISNNVPLPRVARFFARICASLIIEFVPKSDHKVKKLLATREDVFPDYTRECFERDFSELFAIVRSDKIKDSDRVLYLMRRR